MDDQDLTIKELIKQSHETAVKKGWWEDGDRPAGEMMLLMVCEVAEAFEEYRNGHSSKEIFYREDGKPEGQAVEFADVIIRICDYAGQQEMPLLRAISEKLEYNKTRSYRHGGKLA